MVALYRTDKDNDPTYYVNECMEDIRIVWNCIVCTKQNQDDADKYQTQDGGGFLVHSGDAI